MIWVKWHALLIVMGCLHWTDCRSQISTFAEVRVHCNFPSRGDLCPSRATGISDYSHVSRFRSEKYKKILNDDPFLKIFYFLGFH